MRWHVLYEKTLSVQYETKRIMDEEDDKIIYEDGSVYHKFNILNDLDNKSWLKFQKSWFVVNPPPREKDVLLHPAKFPEEMVIDFVKFFTKMGDIVFDPMVGTGSTLIACARCGRSGVGVEYLEKYARVAAERLERELHTLTHKRKNKSGEDVCSQTSQTVNFKIIVGDSRDIKEMPVRDVDYIITSPPYWNMLREKGFETQSRRAEKNLDVYYSNDSRDLGNIEDYDEFINETAEILSRAGSLLKNGKYMTVIVKNVKKGARFYPLAWDLAKAVERKGFMLKDEKIWCQDNIKLAPYGYGRAWVSNTMHHYCLNFRKV